VSAFALNRGKQKMSDVVTSSSPQIADTAALLARFRITDSDLALVKKFG
jgi:hypothetical protein